MELQPTSNQAELAPIATAEQTMQAVLSAKEDIMRRDNLAAIEAGIIEDPKIIRQELAKKEAANQRKQTAARILGRKDSTKEAQDSQSSGSAVVDGRALPALGNAIPEPELSEPQDILPQRENTQDEQSLLEGILFSLNDAADKIADSSFNMYERYKNMSKQRKLGAFAAASIIGVASIAAYKYLGVEMDFGSVADIVPDAGTDIPSTRSVVENSMDSLSASAKEVGEPSVGLFEAAAEPEHNLTELIDQVTEQNIALQEQDTTPNLTEAIERVAQENLEDISEEISVEVSSEVLVRPVEVSIGEGGVVTYKNVAEGQGYIEVLETTAGLTKQEAIELITEHRDELLRLDGFTFGGGDYHNIHIAAPGELNLGDASSTIRSAIESIKATR